MNSKLLIVEEIFNSITHGIGALLSVLCLVALILIARNDSLLKMIGFIVFGASMILMYLMSTLFHSLIFTKAKKVFSVFDYSSIFLLIAGTYTPLSLVLLHGWVRVGLLFLVWSLAICGIVFKSIFVSRFQIIFVVMYLAMGWMAIFLLQPLLAILSFPKVMILLFGGIFYSVGIIFYSWKKLPFSHAIWHLFVLGGSLCHFFIIYSL